MSDADALGPSPAARRCAGARTRGVSAIRRWAWVYAALFFAVVAVGYVPAFNDASGNLFGLFSLQLIDDALHAGSGIWAALAAWRSSWASTLYFKLFGTVYFMDGVVGLIFGRAYLDGGLFTDGPANLDLMTKIATNLPHIIIGGTAVILGFVVARRYATDD
ncbi:MAG: hypothetical protein U0893_18770 [Chloroflexota bacterium]